MDSEKLLIIGCGDLGSRLAHSLSHHRVAVTGLRRRTMPDQAELTYVAADATDKRALTQVLAEGFDTLVITLTPTERSDAGYIQGYVQPCETLIAALGHIDQPPRQILFVSSTAVYGESAGQWVDEATPARPVRYNGIRLLEAEQILQCSELPVSVLRLSGVYGPGRTRLLDKIARGDAPLSDAWTNRIHADDAAGFMAHLLALSRRKPLASLYLVNDDRPARSREVTGWLARQLGVGTGPEEQVETLNKRISNRLLRQTGYALHYPDFTAGFTELIRTIKP